MDMDLLRHAALAGLGFVMLPSVLIAGELAAGTLRAVEKGWCLVRGEVNAVYPRHRASSPKVRALVSFLRERLADVPHWVHRLRAETDFCCSRFGSGAIRATSPGGLGSDPPNIGALVAASA